MVITDKFAIHSLDIHHTEYLCKSVTLRFEPDADNKILKMKMFSVGSTTSLTC